MEALHIGGPLNGKVSETPDDKIMYRAEGHTYAIHLIGPQRQPVWAPAAWCYKKVKAHYDHHRQQA